MSVLIILIGNGHMNFEAIAVGGRYISRRWAMLRGNYAGGIHPFTILVNASAMVDLRIDVRCSSLRAGQFVNSAFLQDRQISVRDT